MRFVCFLVQSYINVGGWVGLGLGLLGEGVLSPSQSHVGIQGTKGGYHSLINVE